MNLHCSQTILVIASIAHSVLYLYEFTLLSNLTASVLSSSVVLYLYEFTLLSNGVHAWHSWQVFYTSMNLHCSQTSTLCQVIKISFYTSMNLHCSQTTLLLCIRNLSFYTSMNLHCSQTSNFENPACNWYVNPHLCYTFLYNKYQHISFLIP